MDLNRICNRIAMEHMRAATYVAGRELREQVQKRIKAGEDPEVIGAELQRMLVEALAQQAGGWTRAPNACAVGP